MKEENIRPWGRYDILLDNPNVKVKTITVEPNQRLSLQSHKHRREHWIVTKGILTVFLSDRLYNLIKGQTITIGKGSKHRAWNRTNEPVEFLEIQTGDYFGEDDIIRYEDDYNR